MNRTFVCDRCRGMFENGNEEEALAEAAVYFPGLKPEEISVICDDCYNRVHTEKHPELVEEAIAAAMRARLGPAE